MSQVRESAGEHLGAEDGWDLLGFHLVDDPDHLEGCRLFEVGHLDGTDDSPAVLLGEGGVGVGHSTAVSGRRERGSAVIEGFVGLAV